MLHYADFKVSDLERSGASTTRSWRRSAGAGRRTTAGKIAWGMIKAEFLHRRSDTPAARLRARLVPGQEHPGGQGLLRVGAGERRTSSVAEPGSAPAHGIGNYAARLIDPDGYEVEIVVAPE